MQVQAGVFNLEMTPRSAFLSLLFSVPNDDSVSVSGKKKKKASFRDPTTWVKPAMEATCRLEKWTFKCYLFQRMLLSHSLQG